MTRMFITQTISTMYIIIPYNCSVLLGNLSIFLIISTFADAVIYTNVIYAHTLTGLLFDVHMFCSCDSDNAVLSLSVNH